MVIRAFYAIMRIPASVERAVCLVYTCNPSSELGREGWKKEN